MNQTWRKEAKKLDNEFLKSVNQMYAYLETSYSLNEYALNDLMLEIVQAGYEKQEDFYVREVYLPDIKSYCDTMAKKCLVKTKKEKLAYGAFLATGLLLVYFLLIVFSSFLPMPGIAMQNNMYITINLNRTTGVFAAGLCGLALSLYSRRHTFDWEGKVVVKGIVLFFAIIIAVAVLSAVCDLGSVTFSYLIAGAVLGVLTLITGWYYHFVDRNESQRLYQHKK